MTNDELNPNDETRKGTQVAPRLIRHATPLRRSFDIRHSSFVISKNRVDSCLNLL
jgi:hypothetical protein